MKINSLNSSSPQYFLFLISIPLLIVIFSGHFLDYLQSFFIGALLCFIFRFPFILYCSAYLWACSISIFIADWHINVSSEPYIINSSGGGGDDRAWELGALDPLPNSIVEPYSKFLDILSKPLFNIYERSFYNLLSINCIFHGLASSAIYKIIRILNYGNIAERFSYFSYLFFPLLAIDGLTLMRDGIIAGLLTIIISLIISNNNFISYKALISLLILSFLRISSGLLVVVGTFITWLLTFRKFIITIKGTFIIFGSIIGLILFSGPVISYLISKEVLLNFFIRNEVSDLLFSDFSSNDTMNRLLSLPGGIKQLALFLFFLLAPFSSPIQLFKNDSYNFFAALFSIWNIFSIKLCIQDFFYQIKNFRTLKNRNYFRFLIFFIICTYFIANYSVQLRHKSFIIPIQIILTAHSLKRNKLFDYSFSWFAGIIYFLLTLV